MPKATPKTRISVRVDSALLDEYRRKAGDNVNLAAAVEDGIHWEIRRIDGLAWLDELEREDPISDEDRAAGERLWQEIESSSTPAPSQRSPKKAARSVRRCGKAI
jgi:post-segregation antitoxin (ccd killing protein)